MKETKVCGVCKKEFEDYISNKRSGFCGLKCYWQARKSGLYPGYWRGKPRSKDTIEKISKTKTGRVSSKKGKIFVSSEVKKKNKALWSSQRRAIKRGNGGSFSSEQWENLKSIYLFTCPCCFKKEPEVKLTVDHIMPVKLGGSNNIENLQGLCPICNCSKHAKDPFKWAQENGRLL